MVNIERINLVIDRSVIDDYNKYYFEIHKRAVKEPISNPYHESMNQWMIMKRPMMNSLKSRWKDFIVWFVENKGYANLHIHKCELVFDTYYSTNRRHDIDNGCPKFIIDGLCASGLIDDDDSTHIVSLLMRCHVDTSNPRTEIQIIIKE